MPQLMLAGGPWIPFLVAMHTVCESAFAQRRLTKSKHIYVYGCVNTLKGCISNFVERMSWVEMYVHEKDWLAM